MARQRTIVGLGDLTYDHIFEARGKHLHYCYSRGGGSIFNLLANITHFGGAATAAGVGGDDSFGEAAKKELQHLSVDTSRLCLLPRRATLVIFETIRRETQKLWTRTRVSMSTTCPICQMRVDDQRLARIERRNLNFADVFANASFVCFDRLTHKRVKMALACREQGVKTALDLGRTAFMRFIPAAEVVAALNAFDVVVIPARVANSLVKRTGVRGIDILSAIGPRLLTYVSKGESGVSLYDSRRQDYIKIADLPPAQVDTVVDDTGAGDAFFAGVLLRLAKYNQLERYSYKTIRKITEDAVSELEPVLRNLGARGHIPLSRSVTSPINPEWQGLTIEDIRDQLRPPKECPFCECYRIKHTTSTKPSKLGSRTNLQLLGKRMLFAIERREAVQRCREVLKGKGTVFTIGTGGSYPVAAFLASLLNKHGDFFAQSIRPFDYIKTAKLTDYVVVISYSGATIDCAEAISYALKLGVPHIVLITAVISPKLKHLLRLDSGEDVLISYGRASAEESRSSKERGFVSIAGTVVPCALWAAAAFDPPRMIEFIQNLNSNNRFRFYSEPPTMDGGESKLATALREGQTLAVLGGGLAWPAILDLESKFAEAGLGDIQLHEVKDFSHGRFISVIGADQPKKFPVILHVGRWHKYEKALLHSLSKNSTVSVLDCEDETMLGALELLIRVQFLAQKCGEFLGKDISRPSKIPEEGLKLYKWNVGLQ